MYVYMQGYVCMKECISVSVFYVCVYTCAGAHAQKKRVRERARAGPTPAEVSEASRSRFRRRAKPGPTSSAAKNGGTTFPLDNLPQHSFRKLSCHASEGQDSGNNKRLQCFVCAVYRLQGRKKKQKHQAEEKERLHQQHFYR